MEIDKKLDELAGEVKELDIPMGPPTGRGGKYLRKDYVKALAMFHLKQKYGSLKDVPVNLKFRFSFQCPQLAEQYSKLRPEERDMIWDSEEVWLSEKIFGVRGTLVYSPKEGWSCFSREISSTDYSYVNYGGKLFDQSVQKYKTPFALDIEIKLGDTGIISTLQDMGFDAENELQAVSTLLMLDDVHWEKVQNKYKTPFKLYVLDVYHWNKKDLRKLSYKEREELFDEVIFETRLCGLNIDRPKMCKDSKLKKAFHEGILKEGGEGTIAVFIDKPCTLTGNRRRDEWVKIKRSIFNFDENKLDDTVDGWIDHVELSQKYPSLIKSASVFAVVNGKEQEIASVELIPLSLRRSNLYEEGVVVELAGDSIVGNRVQNPIIKGIRADKPKHECVLK